jgi:hypothetical protein
VKLVWVGDDENEGGPQVGKQSTDVHGLRPLLDYGQGLHRRSRQLGDLPPGLPVLFEPEGSSALAFITRLAGATTAFSTSPHPPTMALATRPTPTIRAGRRLPSSAHLLQPPAIQNSRNAHTKTSCELQWEVHPRS